ELLAEGGYMVQKIAQVLYPEGREIGFDKSPELAARETEEALRAENVVLFEATLISGEKLARVDILTKRGDKFHLIEEKAKSYDTREEESAKFEGKANLFRTKKGLIVTKWQEYLEDVAFQVMVLRELFPSAGISAFLMMPDKSKTTSIDKLHSFFEINRLA